jgi:large exoprotein involved in heme utilization and adhesion
MLDVNGVAGDIIEPSGNAGNIQLTSTGGNILMTNQSTVNSQSFISSGKAGSITVSAPNGDILFTGVPNELFAPGSLFTISDLDNISASGGIQITAKNLTLANAAIAGDNFSPFVPGNITVTLSGKLSLDGQNLNFNLFGQTSNNTFIQTVARGTARSADLFITAHDINVTNGAFLSTRTVRSGNGGSLNISTENLQLASGGRIRSGSEINNPRRPVIPTGAGGTVNIQGLAGPADSVVIDGAGSGIFTNAQGTGAAGNTTIAAQSVTIQNGGAISASTSGTAPSATGGAIIINATDGVTLTNNAHVTSSSTGPGAAGNININAGNQFAMTNSSVTTEANQSSGGAIKITTNPNGTVELTDSTISASVLNGTGGGGSVNIDPQFVLLQNSHILANAVFGPGGNIFITTNLLLPDSISTISASSQFGQQGTITIQQPIAPASGKIIPLPQKPLVPISLLSQRCAALAGGNLSSFTVAGRDNLPAEPSSWLASPLPLATAELVGSTTSEPETYTSLSEPSDETPVLSLRRIAPPGFLTQSFAVDGSGCTS